MDGTLSVALGATQGRGRLFSARDGGPIGTSAASPQVRSDVREVSGSASPSRATVLVLASPNVSIQVLSSPSSSVQL